MITAQVACCTQTACACGGSAEAIYRQVSTLNTLAFDAARCIGCGTCITVCPHRVFGYGDDIVQIVRPDACMECGACQRNCPANALQVDSGVGCAAAMINAALRGLPEPTCGCDTESCC